MGRGGGGRVRQTVSASLFNKIERMLKKILKPIALTVLHDLLPYADVVVKTINLDISLCLRSTAKKRS